MGCYGSRKPPFVFLKGIPGYETTLDVCPWRVVDAEALSIVEYYNYSKLGLLPEPGSVNDQPEKLLRAMSLVGAVVNEKLAKEAKDAERENKE
jgi:hypothetical protein